MSEHAPAPFGILSEFRSADEVLGATQQLRPTGVTRWDVYGPAPIEEIERTVPASRGHWLTLIMLIAAITGACLGYFIQYWASVIDYPINVGGRPLNGWPGFVPMAWEVCALFTVYFGFFAFLLFCRLPRLHHPIFAAPGFERATQDRFFICIEAADAHYDPERLRGILERAGAIRVDEIAS